MSALKKTGLVVLATAIAAYGALVVYAYWPAPEAVSVAALTQPGDQFVTVNDLSIRYRSYGEHVAGGPTFVLMHGFGNSLQSFRNLAPLLAEAGSVVALDLPGYGLSSIPVDYDYGNANQAATVMAVVRALGIERPIYVGHSMGGAIAVHLGVQDKTTVGLVLIDPGIFATGVPAATQFLPFPFPRISAKLFGNRDWRAQFLKQSFVDPSVVTSQVLDDLMMTARREDYWAGATAMMGSFAPGGEPALLPDVKTPVLLVFGEADRNHPDALRRQLHDALPGSTLIVIKGAGHYPHEEKAVEVAEAVKTMAKVWAGAATIGGAAVP
ncbi:MAG: alpha/beta hydrolase [Rhodospirillaceae bacterium]|nr:alpha/beta hydrolase [Rhodospirillaceae bacterium]